ncbi:hypothetical protein C7M30_04122 [Bacillus subtilis]|nr:hypothetical protein BSP4_34920 [Bacillus subtilis subsp. subtilis]QHM20386.1 hypothetical protein C7M30_04122 [Bacillus subtilis]CAF1791062.1 hypothetical protein NRS6131_00196 [Bacillus subtilis]CAI6288060.1 hypothetical protein NRS6131_12075 [Bacillus subtilis]
MAKNIKEIKLMIEKAAIQPLHKSSSNVKQVMSKTGQDHVEEDIYSAYSPYSMNVQET